MDLKKKEKKGTQRPLAAEFVYVFARLPAPAALFRSAPQ